MARIKAKGTDNDVHLISNDKQDALMDHVRNIDNRIQGEFDIDHDEPGIPHTKFKRQNFGGETNI